MRMLQRAAEDVLHIRDAHERLWNAISHEVALVFPDASRAGGARFLPGSSPEHLHMFYLKDSRRYLDIGFGGHGLSTSTYIWADLYRQGAEGEKSRVLLSSGGGNTMLEVAASLAKNMETPAAMFRMGDFTEVVSLANQAGEHGAS